jgi:hypothetical protein
MDALKIHTAASVSGIQLYLACGEEGFIQLAHFKLQRSGMTCGNKEGDPGRPWISPES